MKVGERIVCRRGHLDSPLLAGTFQLHDDVLLQDPIVLERLAPGIEEVQLTNRGSGKNELSERPVVGTVAEAPWDNGDQFAAGHQQLQRQRDEGGVEVDGLDATRRRRSRC